MCGRDKWSGIRCTLRNTSGEGASGRRLTPLFPLPLISHSLCQRLALVVGGRLKLPFMLLPIASIKFTQFTALCTSVNPL